MKKFLELTPQDFLDAYTRTGLIPMKKSFYENFNGHQCGCALTALLMDNGEEVDAYDLNIAKVAALNYDEELINIGNFFHGFDGYKNEEIYPDMHLSPYYTFGEEVASFINEKVGLKTEDELEREYYEE